MKNAKTVKKSCVTSVRLKPEIFSRLEKLSKKSSRTKSYYINTALTEMIEDFEDMCDAEEVLARIRSGKEKTIPAEVLYKEIGL